MKIDRDRLSKKMSMLDNAQLATLVKDYYKGVPVKKILMKYQLSGIKELGLVHELPVLIFNEKCPNCGAELRTELLARTGKHRSRKYCLNLKCMYEKTGGNMQINNLIDESEARKIIDKVFNTDIKLVKYDLLSMKEKTILSAYLWLTEEAEGKVKPIATTSAYRIDQFNLMPSGNDTWDAMRMLSQSVISVLPNSKIDAFNFNDSQEIISHMIPEVNYRLNINDVDRKELYFPSFKNTEENQLAFYNCWLEIALMVLNEYLVSKAEDLIKNLDTGKTRIVLSKYLTIHSVMELKLLIDEAMYEYYWYSQQEDGNCAFDDILLKKVQRISKTKLDNSDNELLEELPHSKWYDILFKTITKLGKDGYTKIPTSEVTFNN